ncbi:MAG: glutamate racemase [Verrucomicrobia bacterium]|nr:glutamate racemase [Verrucomicrobiota bacterium]
MKSPNELPIGIFDSGVGGLTVVRQIHRALPHEDLLYLGDTARVPYGTKSPETVIRFACEDAQFLVEKKVKAIVIACNTASAWALPALEREFALPIFGVIQPGSLAAARQTRHGRVGVIGTSATIRSGAYERAMHALDPALKIFTRACPLLVPLVEEGWTNHAVTRAVLREYLAPLLKQNIDTLVLGCTHYPLLKPAIRRVVGAGVALVDSAASCADFVRARLRGLALTATARRRGGKIHSFVTDEPDRFAQLAQKFLALATEPAHKAELPTWSGK